MAKKRKLDLFGFLGQISRKNAKFYATLSEDEQKEVVPFVNMRWLTGTTDERQIFLLNELVNPFVFTLQKHKELLVHLMTISASGIDRRYKFNKVKSKKTTSTPKSVNVVKRIYGYNTLDALDALKILKNDEILSFAEQLGMQKPEIAAIKKELKTRNG